MTFWKYVIRIWLEVLPQVFLGMGLGIALSFCFGIKPNFWTWFWWASIPILLIPFIGLICWCARPSVHIGRFK